jgi:exosortase
MSEIAREALPLSATRPQNSFRWLLYGLWVMVSLVVFARPVGSVIRFALHNDDASHIFLIPLISAAIVYLERRTIFRRICFDFRSAVSLLLVAALICALTLWSGTTWHPTESLAALMLGLVFCWIAGFALLFGRDALLAARFSLLLLFLTVPLPEFLRSSCVYFLQKGSAAVVTALFELTGVPFLREGFVFRLASVSIEIAEECSGIRSSMAVLILALVAAHFYLRTFWKQALFVLASLFAMALKNGVRITTLTLLAVYVNPSFLFGRLHRDGGVVFFLMGLALLVPILWIIMRSEAPRGKHVRAVAQKGQSQQRN